MDQEHIGQVRGALASEQGLLQEVIIYHLLISFKCEYFKFQNQSSIGPRSKLLFQDKIKESSLILPYCSKQHPVDHKIPFKS